MTQTPHTPRVLIFDSGVGSLSIGAEIHRQRPDIDLLYIMDRGGFPYGEWQEAALVEHICREVTAVLAEEPADLLVMACNSASTAVLPALRASLSIPVVGVVPAIKPAAAISQSGVIGLLATPGTIARPYTAQLIEDFAREHCVIAVGSKELAPAVEALFWGEPVAEAVWQRAVAELEQHPRFPELDTLVLACTHFPLVKNQLAAHLPPLQWVDSGEAIARRVDHLLCEAGWPRLTAQQDMQQGKQEARVLGIDRASEVLLAKLEQRHVQFTGR